MFIGQKEMNSKHRQETRNRIEGLQVSVEELETDESKRHKNTKKKRREYKSEELNFQNDPKEIGGKEVRWEVEEGNKIFLIDVDNLRALQSVVSELVSAVSTLKQVVAFIFFNFI